MSTATAQQIATGRWAIDPVHSHVGFGVKHMVVSTFRGSFDEYDGSLTSAEDGSPVLRGAVKVDSLMVKDENLAAHLASPEFFDSARYPEIAFTSTDVNVGEDGELEVEGDLTIKDNTHRVTARGSVSRAAHHARRQREDRRRARGRHRPPRVRARVERAAPQGRVRARQRRQARGHARAREGGVTAMKILGLSGSLRRDSHNTRLLRGAGTLLPEGVELDVFDGLGAIPPFNEDEESSPPAEVLAFKEAIAAADGLLIATPEYNSSIPGVLKNAIDWASRPRAGSPIASKPAAVIGASTGLFGAVWAQAETRKVLGSTGARVVDRELPIGGVRRGSRRGRAAARPRRPREPLGDARRAGRARGQRSPSPRPSRRRRPPRPAIGALRRAPARGLADRAGGARRLEPDRRVRGPAGTIGKGAVGASTLERA